MRVAVLSAVLLSACASSESPPLANGDAQSADAPDVDNVDTGAATDSAADSSSDVVDAPTEDASPDVASDAATDGDASGCMAPDIVVPASATTGSIYQLYGWFGYLWIVSTNGLFRTSFSGGPVTKVGSFGGSSELHVRGSKLLVADGLWFYDLDPTTLANKKIASIDGAWDSYDARSTLVGDSLLTLVNDGLPGSELLRVDLATSTSTSLWKGTKARGLHRSKDRTFVFGAKKLFETFDDPGVTTPALDMSAYASVTPLFTDDTATYMRVNGSTSDLVRVAHGSTVVEPLMAPAFVWGEAVGKDAARIIHVITEGELSSPDVVAIAYSGGVWSRGPCVSTTSSFMNGLVIEGGKAYVSTYAKSSSNSQVIRVPLP